MTSIRTSTKVAQVLRDIEAARCRGKWQVIPDLAKRYKKYCPSGTVLEQTILIEAALSRLTDRAEQEQSIVFENGTKDAVKLQQRITADTSKPFLHQLHAVLALPETDDDTPVQREFAKIILARCHFECGQYRDTLDIVEQLAFSKSDVSSGYNFILFLQARAMKALSYEQLGDITAAMQSYQGIVSLLEEAPEESLDQKVLVEWAEEALCRAIVLNTGAQAVDDVTITLGFIRSYQKVTGSVSSLWRPHKRLYTLRHSIKYLSDLYREGQYVTGTDASVARYQFAAELMQLNATYERLLFSTLPKSGEKNRMLFEFLEQMADDLSYIGDTDPRHLLGLKQVLYRAAEHTFNSPTISRLLFHTLIQMGDYEEAIYALRSYLYLVGLGSQTWDEARQKGEALIASNGKICVYPHIAGGALERLVDDSTSSKNSIASHRTNEYESTEDILNVLLAAVKMYCLHMGQGSEAVEYAEMARLKMEKAELDSSLRPKVYLTASSAYIYLAYQTRDSHLRSTYFQKALDYLNESSTADSSTWETYYLLALLHATTRDIQSVIPLISKALQLHPAHIPSWHLLTLACSCPTQDDYEHAIQACDIGLRQAQEVDVDPADQLRLHITRTLLLEKMQGPQTALEAQEELFAMYSKVITPDISLLDSSVYNDEMVLSGPFNNLDENSIAGMPRRVSEASIHLKVDESQISASKSHDEIRGKPKNMRGTTTRARSASSFSGKHLNSNGHSTFLAVPSEDGLSTKTSSTQNAKQHHHHHLPFHLHSSRGSSKRSNGELLPKSMHKMGSNKVSQAPSIHGSTQTDLDDNISVLSSSMNSFYSVQQPGISSAKRPLSIRLKQQESKRLLVDLWLLSACSFLKLGKHDEALKAVQEAENIDASSNSRIYCVLGRIFLAQNQLEDATDAFEKAIRIDASDVESRIWLARVLIQNDSMDSAEGLLEQATKEFAWDNAEAWLLLAEIYRKSDRLDRAKDCMMYALDLANTTPIQPFSILPCFV